jgi:hypothetical protein
MVDERSWGKRDRGTWGMRRRRRRTENQKPLTTWLRLRYCPLARSFVLHMVVGLGGVRCRSTDGSLLLLRDAGYTSGKLIIKRPALGACQRMLPYPFSKNKKRAESSWSTRFVQTFQPFIPNEVHIHTHTPGWAAAHLIWSPTCQWLVWLVIRWLRILHTLSGGWQKLPSQNAMGHRRFTPTRWRLFTSQPTPTTTIVWSTCMFLCPSFAC